jgi:hypothetical protein
MLQNLLDNLYERFGQTPKKVLENRNLIRSKIKKYLKENPLYIEDGELITIEDYSFYSNGVLLLGDENEQKAQVGELKRRMPDINWTAVSGIIGVGLVHLYSWWLYKMAGNIFGPSTATGYNVTDAYVPRGGNNFEPYSLTYDNTAADFNAPDYVPQGGTQAGVFAPLRNMFQSLTYDNSAVGFPNSNLGFPTNTDVGFPCLAGPAPTTTAVGFPTTTDYVPEEGMLPGLFAQLRNNFEPYSLRYDNSDVGFPNSNLGFPTNTDVGFPCLAGPAFDTAVDFPTTPDFGVCPAITETAVGFPTVCGI